jgi:predicted AlkP superfamily phosphohydrolase/phosphomutase
MKEQDLKLKIAELKDTIVFLRKELELIKNKNKMENKETVEEAAERLYSGVDRQVDRMLFINGAKWQQERSYSEDDLEEAFKSGFTNCYNNDNLTFGEWFEQFKKK